METALTAMMWVSAAAGGLIVLSLLLTLIVAAVNWILATPAEVYPDLYDYQRLAELFDGTDIEAFTDLLESVDGKLSLWLELEQKYDDEWADDDDDDFDTDLDDDCDDCLKAGECQRPDGCPVASMEVVDRGLPATDDPAERRKRLEANGWAFADTPEEFFDRTQEAASVVRYVHTPDCLKHNRCPDDAHCPFNFRMGYWGSGDDCQPHTAGAAVDPAESNASSLKDCEPVKLAETLPADLPVGVATPVEWEATEMPQAYSIGNEEWGTGAGCGGAVLQSHPKGPERSLAEGAD
jgi:hypothetical protein